MPVSKGSAGGEEKREEERRSGRNHEAGFKCTLREKQLKYTRPRENQYMSVINVYTCCNKYCRTLM